jgi:hypothetical protein
MFALVIVRVALRISASRASAPPTPISASIPKLLLSLLSTMFELVIVRVALRISANRASTPPTPMSASIPKLPPSI